jgi:hypothetical protein
VSCFFIPCLFVGVWIRLPFSLSGRRRGMNPILSRVRFVACSCLPVTVDAINWSSDCSLLYLGVLTEIALLIRALA